MEEDAVKNVGFLNGANSRVGNGWFAIWIILAAFLDLITLIPFFGDFLEPIFLFSFIFFLWKKGCGILNVQRIATELATLAIKLVPALQELPATVLGVVIVILLVRFEDKTGIKFAGAISKGGLATLNPVQGPANQGGIRAPQTDMRRPLNESGRREPQETSTARPTATATPQENEMAKKGWRVDETTGNFVNDDIKPLKDKPDWARDQEAGQYAKDQNDRYELMIQMGHSPEEASRMAREATERDARRRQDIKSRGY